MMPYINTWKQLYDSYEELWQTYLPDVIPDQFMMAIDPIGRPSYHVAIRDASKGKDRAVITIYDDIRALKKPTSIFQRMELRMLDKDLLFEEQKRINQLLKRKNPREPALYRIMEDTAIPTRTTDIPFIVNVLKDMINTYDTAMMGKKYFDTPSITSTETETGVFKCE